MADISMSADISRAQGVLNRAPDKINFALRGGMEDSRTYMVARLQRYPEERPNQVYVRTKTLARSISGRIEGSGLGVRAIIGSNGNIAPYNRRVLDRGKQGRLFRGRWTTIQDHAEQATPTVQRFFDDRLRAAGLDR